MITGKPISLASFFASSADSIGSGLPGSIGTPAAAIVRRASTLSPIIAMTSALRADEFYIAVFADLGEGRRLGKKSVTGMDRVDVRDFGRADDRRNIEIALSGRWRPDADRLVGVPDMQCFAVGFGMHGDGLDAHLLARPDDPARDLAAISYQNFANLTRHF